MTEQTVITADVTDADLADAQMVEYAVAATEMMDGVVDYDDDEGEPDNISFVRFMMQMQGSKLEKPDVADAPEGATVLLQNGNGIWVFGNTKELALHEEEDMWVLLDDAEWNFHPELMGWTDPTDWKNSLVLLSDDVKVVPLPTGKPTWDEAPDEAKTLIGFNGAWRFTTFAGIEGRANDFIGIGAGDVLNKTWFDKDMPEGSFVEYRNGEPTQEELNAMGKPSWDDAPEGATVLVRNSDGSWRFGSFAEVKQHTVDGGKTGWVPADMNDDDESDMEGAWLQVAYYDASPIELVAEYRQVVEG